MSNYLTKQGLEEKLARKTDIEERLLPDIMEVINAARAQGDLKENAGYQSAMKSREELVEELSSIQDTLQDYVLIDEEAASHSKTVKVGSSVRIEYIDLKQVYEVKIVGTSEIDVVSQGSILRISNESDLAKAILGKREDQEATFKAKQGKMKIKILEIF